SVEAKAMFSSTAPAIRCWRRAGAETRWPVISAGCWPSRNCRPTRRRRFATASGNTAPPPICFPPNAPTGRSKICSTRSATGKSIAARTDGARQFFFLCRQTMCYSKRHHAQISFNRAGGVAGRADRRDRLGRRVQAGQRKCDERRTRFGGRGRSGGQARRGGFLKTRAVDQFFPGNTQRTRQESQSGPAGGAVHRVGTARNQSQGKAERDCG